MEPTYISSVVRTLACPAMQDTSVGSSFQVNRAVVQNTCRRLCQVHLPLPPGSRQPIARYARLRTLRLKLEDRQCLPAGEGKISPSGLVPASCSAVACSMRAASFSASG